MDRLRVLLREPALLLDAVETGLVLLVALGLHLSNTQQTDIVALIIAAIAVIKGASTLPFPVTIITDLARAVLVLVATFGLDLPPDRVAVIVTFIGTFVTLVQRVAVTPRYDPVVAVGGAGSGPVSGESG